MMRCYKTLIWVWFGVMCVLPGFSQGLEPDSLVKESLDTPSFVLDLSQDWKLANGKLVDFPYQFPKPEDRLVLSKQIHIPAGTLPDTLYWYVDHIAWHVSLIINGSIIGMNSRPFLEWKVQLPKEALRPGYNTLQLIFNSEQNYPNYPEKVHVISGKPKLLDVSALSELTRLKEQGRDNRLDHDKPIAFWAPYFGQNGYLYNEWEAHKVLYHIKKLNIRKVHFAFPPPDTLLRLCREWDLHIEDSIDADAAYCLLNEYPYEARNFMFASRFWLMDSGKRTRFYGETTMVSVAHNLPFGNSVYLKGVIIVLGVLSLLSLLLLRLVDSRLYFTSIVPGQTFKRVVFDFADLSIGNINITVMLFSIHILHQTISLALLVYTAALYNRWEDFNIFSDWSLVNTFFYPGNRWIEILSKSLLVSLGIFFIKGIVLNLMRPYYNVKNLVSNGLNLELLVSLPWLIIVSLPLFILAIFPAPDLPLLWGSFFVLSLFFLVRYLVSTYIGLSQLFNFSPSQKILYICTFNLLPVVILV